MLTLLVVLLGVVCASGVEVPRSYHDAGGIPLAVSIKAQEDAAHDVLGDIAPRIAGLVVYFSGQVSACGASLLTANRLVTAAHCWNDGANQAILFEVVLGSAYLFYGGTRVQTSSVVMHPQWTPSLFRNDVAMIYLPINVQFTSSIQPISLPTGSDMFEPFTGLLAVAAGYGKADTVGISQFVADAGCQLEFPSAFARITSFYNFIIQHM